jgi:hypothetical protein
VPQTKLDWIRASGSRRKPSGGYRDVPLAPTKQAQGMSYLGRTSTGWIAPALPGAFHLFDHLISTAKQRYMRPRL